MMRQADAAGRVCGSLVTGHRLMGGGGEGKGQKGKGKPAGSGTHHAGHTTHDDEASIWNKGGRGNVGSFDIARRAADGIGANSA